MFAVNMDSQTVMVSKAKCFYYTYFTMSSAEDRIRCCVNLVTLLMPSPSSPRSNTSMQPFSLSVYKICRELSTSILIMGSSSYNAAFRNEGTKNERALVE